MEKLWETYFGRQVIARSAFAKVCIQVGTARIGIAGLYHEVPDDAMEEQTVIEMTFAKADEIVAVPGRFIIQLDGYVALVCVENDMRPLIGSIKPRQ